MRKIILDLGIFRFGIFIVSVFLFSCEPQVKKTASNNENTVQVQPQIKGYDAGYSANIKCLDDAFQSYDVYLPDSLGSHALPVIFIFDAHARGHLPVKLYSGLAETFGCLLIASNNSKNGQDMETGNSIYQHLITDVNARIKIDSRRIYVMGFSGGARVASGLAINNMGIAGVIGCSAGFPKTDKPPANNFNYIGIVGNEDFNMAEMKSLDAKLGQTSIRHQLLIFNGKHDWCPTQTMKDAFYWITFNAMRDQLISRNDQLMEAFISEQDSLLLKLKKEGNDYAINQVYYKLVNYLDGIYDVSNYKEKYNQMKMAGKVNAYEAYLNRISSEEARLQQQYQGFMAERQFPYWQAEIAHLNESIKKDKKPEEALFKKRLLSYLSLLAYTYSNKALDANQLELASGYIKIYALVDPTNAEHAYLNAVLMMKYNSPDNAIASLKESINLGFEDKERIMEQPEFKALKGNPAFDELLKGLK